MREFHVGERATATVTLRDASGNVTDRFDTMMTGIQYTLTDPAAATITDPDAEPRDVELEFIALTAPGVGQFLDVSLDGNPGDGVTAIQIRSEPWAVVPGDAVDGMLELALAQAEPEPPAA